MTDHTLRRSPRAHPRVLILGDRPVVAVTACRALGRAGYDVGVTGSRRWEPAGVSRYASRYHRIPPLDGAANAWGVALEAVVTTVGYDVVLATSDAGVARLLNLDLPVPTCPEISDRHVSLIDKGLLAILCAKASVDYPRTYRPRTSGDDEEAARGVRETVVVKAARSAVATSDGLTFLPGARLVDDPIKALQALEAIRRRGVDPILQEYLEGQKLQAIIIRRAGATSFRMAFRVQREFPPEMGAESMLEGLPTTSGIGAELVGMLERLADAAAYDGVLAAEFLETVSDRLCVIDVNPRLWGSLAFAELLGLRVTERAIRDVLRSNQLPMPEEVSNRRYHHLLRELRWLRARPRPIASILATTSTRDVWDVPSLSDPLPELLWLMRRLTRAWPGPFKRTRSPHG